MVVILEAQHGWDLRRRHNPGSGRRRRFHGGNYRLIAGLVLSDNHFPPQEFVWHQGG